MKITKRGVALSALSVMAGASMLGAGQQVDAATTVDAKLNVTANVQNVLTLQLEDATSNDGTGSGSHVDPGTIVSINNSTDIDNVDTYVGTLDFGTVDAAGSSNEANGYFEASLRSGYNAVLHELDATNSYAKKGVLIVEGSASGGNTGELHATNDNTAFPKSGTNAGALYVIGANVPAAGTADAGPTGIIRNRVLISGGQTADVTLKALDAAQSGASFSDGHLPLYVSLARKSDGTAGGAITASEFAAGTVLPLPTAYGGGSGSAGDIALVGTDNNSVDLTGSQFFNADFENDEWTSLNYAIRVDPTETAGGKAWVVLYTAVGSF